MTICQCGRNRARLRKTMNKLIPSFAHRDIFFVYEKYMKKVSPERRTKIEVRTQELIATAQLLERITVEPGKCGGRPCIRGMRIRVADDLELLSSGAETAEILSDFPDLEREDILACLLFAAEVIKSKEYLRGLLIQSFHDPHADHSSYRQAELVCLFIQTIHNFRLDAKLH